MINIADQDDDQPEQHNTNGFSVHKEDQKTIEQFEDFQRYSDKKAWDRAFKSLGTVLDTAKNSQWLVPLRDGFFVPTRQRVADCLMSLPAEGKAAYRLFYDAQAKQLWDQCQADEAAGKGDDLDKLRNVVDRYLITGVGDVAADRLGDALMEAGDYMAAARIYEQVLMARPDSELPAVRLQTKRAIALLRGGYSQAYKELAARIREKHAGELVKIAGKQMAVEDFLDSLEKSVKSSATQPTHPTTTPAIAEQYPPIALPTGDAAWQEVFLDSAINEQISAAGNNMGWGGQMTGLTNAAPAAVADQRRVYLNWYGIVWAVDIDTGKVAWWSEPFKALSENNKAQMLIQFMVDERRFAVVLAGDNLLTVAVRLDRLQNQEPFRLNCLEAATGKKKWSSETGSLSGWAFLGSPLVMGDTIYIMAHPRENQQLSLLAIQLAGGQLLWSRELGQPQLVNGWNGMPIYPVPSLKYDQGFIYVMTNNGATIAVEAATHSIAWSFSYEIPYEPPNEGGMMVINGMWVRAGGKAGMEAGAAFLHDGKLIFKGGGISAMYALDLAGPKLSFKRPVDDDQLLAAVDDTGLYLIGPYFSFIDSQTHVLKWAPPLPTDGQRVQPLRAGNDFLVFTGRGIYRIDPAQQRMEIFRGIDVDSLGGSLLHVGNKLITVSNRAVTAYVIAAQTSAR